MSLSWLLRPCVPQREWIDSNRRHRHARANLPKYAVPIFIRLVSEPLSTGNHKQNKVPLKAEGVDPDKVSSGDAIYWARGDTYVPFTRADWDGLSQGRARL